MEDFRVTQTGDEIQGILNQAPIDTSDIAGLKETDAALDSRLETVEGKIPAGASAENPLTDKQYVDDSIASASATFRGTYNEVEDLELTTAATHAEIAAALADTIDVADNNDYCFVQIPTSDATPTEIGSIERYKFVTGTGWQYEYTLNNSGFTADQWAAINSGITSDLVAKLTDLPANAELETLLNGKANAADVYTKSETYNKTELDAQLGAKANSADVYEKSQTYTKQEVDALITTPEVQYVTVTATSGTTSVTDVLPATGAANTIYRVGSWDGTQYATGVYSEYSWNGTTYILLDVKNYGFATGSDFDNPTTAQRELVATVGSVLDGISEGVFDLTAKTGDSYATLADALTAANTSIPTNKKKGGMSIKFVQSSDNKYVQFRYMLPYGGNTTAENNKFVNPTNWQGVDDVPTAGSSNLVKSGGAAESILSFKEDWNNTFNFNAKIAGTGFLFNDPTANCKIFTISNGDQIRGKAGSFGSYLAILKEMPVHGVSTIPFATGYSSRTAVNANSNFSFSIDSEDAKYLIVEDSRTDSSVLQETKPVSLSINGLSLFINKTVLSECIAKNLKQGIFIPKFNNYILITSTTITIPAGTRLVYNNTYYSNNADVIIERSSSAQYQIIVFDKSNAEYKAIEGFYDFTSTDYLFCFYVMNNGDCSLSNRLYKIDGNYPFVLNTQYNADIDLINRKLSNTGNTSYPCKNDRYIGTFNGTATLLSGVELVKGNKYRVELRTDTAFTFTVTSTLKIYNADSESTILKIADLINVEISNNVFEFVWPYADASNYRIGIYAFTSGTYKLDIKVLNLGVYTVNIGIIPSAWKDGCYIKNDAQIVSNADWCVSQKFKCKYKDTISWKSGSTTANYTISMVIFDAQGTKLGYLSNGNGVNRSLALTDASLYEDADYVIASFYKPAKDGYIKIDDGENVTEFDFNIDSSETILDIRGEIDGIKDEAYRLKDNDIILGNKHKESSLVNTLLYTGPSDIKVNNKLSLLHFTDLHGDPVNLARIVEFWDYYAEYLDDCIHTGDSVTGTINDTNVFTRVSGAGNILNVAGNHEAWLQTTDTDYNATEKQVYDKMFAPSIANWNVVQPTDAATNGQCYYYKDYRNYRLIVLDNVHWHTRNGVSDDNPTQKAWFESVLSDAATNNKIVVCAMHYPPVNIVPLNGALGFNDYGTTDSTVIGDGWFAKDEIFDCVDTFITNNGIFVCWLVGHTHKDYVGYVKEHTNQPIVVLRNAGLYSRSGTNKNVSGTAAQDCFNFITFSWVNSDVNLVKITRIGNDADMYNRSKKCLCFNTVDGTVLYAG